MLILVFFAGLLTAFAAAWLFATDDGRRALEWQWELGKKFCWLNGLAIGAAIEWLLLGRPGELPKLFLTTARVNGVLFSQALRVAWVDAKLGAVTVLTWLIPRRNL